MQIKKLEISEMLQCGMLFQNSYLWYCISRMHSTDSAFGFYQQEQPAGIALVFAEGENSFELMCFCIPDETDKPACMKLLLQKLSEAGAEKLLWRVTDSSPEYPLIQQMADIFHPAEESVIYRCKREPATEEIWQNIRRAHCEGICRYLQADGWQSVCFADASQALLSQLRDKRQSFDMHYDTEAVLSGIHGDFMPELSSIAVYDNQPFAVAMVTKAGKSSLIFQLVSASSDSPQAGAVMLAVTDVIDRIFLSEYQTISFCYLKKNQQMRQIARRIFMKLAYRESNQINYQHDFSVF